MRKVINTLNTSELSKTIGNKVAMKSIDTRSMFFFQKKYNNKGEKIAQKNTPLNKTTVTTNGLHKK